ncbi:MAG: hypothetical protein LH650_06370 [Chloroflexi bacterium]|nr:hypothetical protein [Chloroflexota bacterium]
MDEQPVAGAPQTTYSRPELLRLLHDDPRAVSRAAIKAAFADGRLGDQDLDIPVLAGMRRITELLADLGPGAAATGTSRGTDLADTPAHGTPTGGRATATSVRVSELDATVAALTDRVATLESSLATARAARSGQDAAVAAQARTLRLMGIVLAAVAVAASLAVILALVAR